MTIKLQFNLAESSASLEASDYCVSPSDLLSSPIDDFYASRDRFLAKAFVAPFDGDQELQRLLLVSIFSAAEVYFRRVISEVLDTCPLSAEKASSQMIPVGAFSMFSERGLGFAIGETKGLTSSGEVVSRTRSLLGIVIEPTSSVGVAISEYENVCHFRHAIVHCSGELLFLNKKELGVHMPGRVCLDLGGVRSQVIVKRVENAVRSYNTFVANKVLANWFVHGVMVRNWNKDRARFERLCSIFLSRSDAIGGVGGFDSYTAVRAAFPRR